MEVTSTEEKKTENKSIDYKRNLQYFIMGLMNLYVVVTVNGLYIYSTYQDLNPTTSLYIQIGMALFKILYNKCLPLLTMNIRDPITNISVRSMLNIFNNLFIPCLATAFTSPACYQVRANSTIFINHERQ